MSESKFIKSIHKVSDAFFKVEDFVTLITFCVMLILIVVQVFVRCCLTTPLAWTEELTRAFFIVSSFWGGAACVKARSNVEINLLTSVIRKASKGNSQKEELIANSVDILANLIGAVFSIIISYYMWGYTMDLKRQGQISIALEYPLFWGTTAITVALVLMGIHYLFHLIESAYYVATHVGSGKEGHDA